MEAFRTHTGQIVKGKKLQAALNAVADDYIESTKAIRKENLYAAHVTEETKIANYRRGMRTAERIRQGIEPCGFWLWQRINIKLTGECIALLP